ncbi:thioesterase-like superfamily-domain-containing protein [Fusarium redolens]|uniref:Thioesterase-like superfamily-domain-containing protein n=1 Tax=Fusarium redolens TaxID=48865 RepID=A0A9P9HNA8_FUSRE|nr:thioesterase-like superfamily-domain-containing protein [Fusarium redolens]KAH7260675.1 thioesterase-like superfamily-domain-containing protein [Fusarium redolens]
MSASHLPNSHPDVTPTWRPFKFPRIPLPDAIETSPVADSDGQRYSGSVPLDWCGNSGRRLAAHGGYCATVLMMTARQYYRDKHGSLENMEPLNMSVEFLEPLPQGRFEIALETLSRGKRTSTIEARLKSLEIHEHKVCTVAIVRLGILKDDGHVNNMQPSVWPLPDRTKDCTRWSDASYYYMNPPASTIRVYTPNDGNAPLWSERFGGQNTRYQWVKLDDGREFRFEHLPVLADLVPPIFLNYAENGMEAASSWGLPTTTLNIMFRCEITPQDWLLTRTTMKRIHGGRFDMNIEILNEHGQLLASCVQLCSVIPIGKSTSKTAGKL